jgi:hypothetical protein
MPSQPLDNFASYYQVEHDPDRAGGFSRGACLSAESVEHMLRSGTFTPGTKLRRGGRGALLVVRRDGPVKQVLVEARDARKL